MRTLPAILLATLTLLTACGKSNPTSPATSTAAAPARTGPAVISLGPALTLLTTQISAAPTLVGVSSYDSLFLPEGMQDLPVVGDYNTVKFELLQKLAPTAILMQKAEDRVAPQLRDYCTQHHVVMINARMDTIADIFATTRRIGTVTGKSDEAEKQIALTQLRIDRLKQRVAGKPRPKVLYIVGTSPIFVVGGERFMNEMIEMAGGDNLGATIKKDFPDVTREMILQLKPDIILVSAPGDTPRRENDPRVQPWLDLPTPAAADRHVYLVTDPLGLMPSLAIADSAKILGKFIHPEIDFDAPLPAATAPTTHGGGQ